jgi:hypothetical protein
MQISKQWRRPFYLGIVAWLICVLLSGIFAEGAPQVILSYLIVSLLYWISAFVYRLYKSSPSYWDTGIIAAGPIILFFGTLLIWFKMWS